jgi:dolichol-phosphate mannosyltransferase
VILGLTLAGVVDTSLELWILASVLFLGGVQLISVGILGRYLARVHEQSLQRPLYIVSRIVGRGPEVERAVDWRGPLPVHGETSSPVS